MLTDENGYVKKKWLRLFPILIITGTSVAYVLWYSTFMADIGKL